MPISILGIRFDQATKLEALHKVEEFLDDGKQHSIFTPNPEMLVRAQQDAYFKTVLNSGSLNLCDGFGVWITMKLRNKEIKKLGNSIERISGVDFMLDVCRVAEEKGRSVYLLGSGSDEVVKKAAENLQKMFPRLKVVGYDKGPRINVKCQMSNVKSITNEAMKQLNNESGLTINEQEQTKTTNAINAAKPDILFVAFSDSKPEKWIYENLQKLPTVKVAMGVGAAFDYLAGTVHRAPLLMRRLGLEWLYRLFCQPWRARRIFNATFKFFWYFLIK